jgi:hypothetical protein
MEVPPCNGENNGDSELPGFYFYELLLLPTDLKTKKSRKCRCWRRLLVADAAKVAVGKLARCAAGINHGATGGPVIVYEATQNSLDGYGFVRTLSVRLVG